MATQQHHALLAAATVARTMTQTVDWQENNVRPITLNMAGPGDMAAARTQGQGIPHGSNAGTFAASAYQSEAPPGANQQDN